MFDKNKYKEILGAIPNNVKIVGVTKTKTIKDIKEAIDGRIKIIAENYVQEAELKYKELKDLFKKENIEFHLIGHLQSNKAKKAAEIFDCIETLASIKTANILDKECHKINKILKIMIEVNLGEEQKSGIKEQDLDNFIKQIKEMKNLQLIGLMAIPKPLDLSAFKKMKELKEKYNLQELSMGMSQDYKEAINFGSTMIRLGTILFGER